MSARRRIVTSAVVICGVALLGAVIWQALPRVRPPLPAVAKPKAVAAAARRPAETPAGEAPLSDAEVACCAECHADVSEEFADAPHAHTLWRGRGEEILARFLGPDGSGMPADGSVRTFHFLREGDRLYAEGGSPPERLEVSWVIGSGRTGQTPVTVREEPGAPSEGIEYHTSWYPDRGLAMTIGHADSVGGPGYLQFGRPMLPQPTAFCLGCHATGLTLDEPSERINHGDFQPGVRCDRCHAGSRKHLATEGDAPIADLAALSPSESLQRCAECHTKPGQDPESAVPEEVARFTSIGFSRSACFQGQTEIRFDCTSCHDPHRPPPANLHEVALGRCVECHSSVAKPCATEPIVSDCVSCHMPRVTLERDVMVTDHWIRVRRDHPAAVPAAHAVEAPKPP